MKIFHCDHCQQLVFFENVRCLGCDQALAYLPDDEDMATLEPAGALWRRRSVISGPRTYRLCRNYQQENVCNWAVPAADPNPLCLSCRLTRIIPDLSVPGHRQAWYRLEAAKRRLVFGLLALQLPLVNRVEDPKKGLAFEFLADRKDPDAPGVLTGHDTGVITLNVAEADDAERERRRVSMHEPYRTLLGHFRHEIGHYYWDRLIRDSAPLDRFRDTFGDERADYAEALQRHYREGPAPDWSEQFISAYASAHPWEDWAESWAHYLHMVDTLETTAACGLALRPHRPDEPRLSPAAASTTRFEQMMASWSAVTYVLNNLNRGLGQPDGYPFVLPAPAVAKLRLVHELVQEASNGGGAEGNE